jgi:hypothetical protein
VGPCERCRQLILFGGVHFRGAHCLQVAHGSSGFCPLCIGRTTDKGPGRTGTINGVGSTLIPNGEPCPACYSVSYRKWYVFLFIPVIPGKTYLTIWPESHRYVGRLLRQ